MKRAPRPCSNAFLQLHRSKGKVDARNKPSNSKVPATAARQAAGKWEYIYVRKGNAKAIKCLDYLIWSLGQAEYTTKDQASKENYEDIITEVSRTLRILVDDLPQDES